MYSKSDNIEFTSYNDAKESVHGLFDSLRSRYQGNLETSMRGSDFIFDSVQLMYCKCHKVGFKCKIIWQLLLIFCILKKK